MSYLRATLLLCCLPLVACTDSTAAKSTEDTGCIGRGCLQNDTGTGDTTAADTTADTATVADTDDGICGPGELTCVSATISGICLADGSVRELPCATGETCRNGSCEVGTAPLCSPSDPTTCVSGGFTRTCNADGTAFVDTACPTETPYCRDGACTAQLCDPGALSCRGNDVVACNADGATQTALESCAGICVAGQCQDADPCTFTDKEYLGCDFWATYLDNEARGLGFAVSVSNPGRSSVNVTVTQGSAAPIFEGTVAAGDLTLINLGAVSQIDGTGISNAAYRVQADGPVTVHQFNPPNNLGAGYSNDASLLLPANALGTQYRVMAYYSGDDLAVFARLSARWYVTIVASAPGTTEVTVTSPAGIRAGSGVPAIAPGGTQTLTLTQGQVVNLMADRNNGDDPDADDPADLTGMLINATQPVAVFSGSEASYIPDDTGAADHLEQQLYPVSTWGTELVLTKFARRGTEDDVYRVMAANAGTTLRTTPVIPGVDGRTLREAGDAVEFNYNGDFVVSADAPISVGQFMVGSFYPGLSGNCSRSVTSGCAIPTSNECPLGDGTFKRIGDPAFLLPSAASQFRADYTFYVPEGYIQNYIGIALPTGASLILDDATVTATRDPIPGTSWEVVRLPITPGTHSLVAGQPAGLSVYGYGCDVSYAYPGGLDLGDR